MKALIVLSALVIATVRVQTPAATPQPAVALQESTDESAKDTSITQNTKIYRIGGAVKPPKPVKMVDAKFSKEARKKKLSGDVIIRMVVDESGMPQDVTVVRGMGYGLDEEAVKAAQQYRFKPATKDGQPVRVVVNLDVNFRIF